MKNQTILATAVAASLSGISGVADATTIASVVKADLSYSNNGTSAGVFTGATTWSYDDVTQVMTQTGGTFDVRFDITVGTTGFRHTITGLAIGGGGAASATAYTCGEGTFGGTVGASLCGNYNFGANKANETTTTWGPGTAFARTSGGDDMDIGAQQSLLGYNGFTQLTWIGTQLRLTNRSCTLAGTACSSLPDGANTGFRIQWATAISNPSEVPIPAAAWLLGTGVLGLAGRGLRRKKA